MLNEMKHLLPLAPSPCIFKKILRYTQDDNFFYVNFIPKLSAF
jgi:hypothetical protein